MKELKFRAVIPKRNAIIYFTLNDLLQDKFSNREILWKWLEEGNQPDLFTGMKDKNNKEIYENDVIRYDEQYIGIVIWMNGGLVIKYLDGVENRFSSSWCDSMDSKITEVVGSIYELQKLIENERN